jgi:hypothetical protein
MGWSQPGGGCGDVHRTTVMSGALERHQLASAPPSRRCRMAVLPIPPPSRTSAMGEAKWGGMRMRRRCHRRDQILLLHIPPPIRPRSTIQRPRRQHRTRRRHRTTRTKTTTRWHCGTTLSRPPHQGTGEARHGADATSAMACDPSSAGASRPTIPSFPMCRSSPPPVPPPPDGGRSMTPPPDDDDAAAFASRGEEEARRTRRTSCISRGLGPRTARNDDGRVGGRHGGYVPAADPAVPRPAIGHRIPRHVRDSRSRWSNNPNGTRRRRYRPHRRCCNRAGGRTTTVRGTACDRSRRSYGRGWRGRRPRPFP